MSYIYRELKDGGTTRHGDEVFVKAGAWVPVENCAGVAVGGVAHIRRPAPSPPAGYRLAGCLSDHDGVVWGCTFDASDPEPEWSGPSEWDGMKGESSNTASWLFACRIPDGELQVPQMTGTQYREIRERLGLTQSELAALLGITRETVTRRETSPKPIMGEAALAILALKHGLTNPR